MVRSVLGKVRSIAIAVWALGALAACGTCGATAPAGSRGPSLADLAASSISGPWQLTVTVRPYAGPPPASLAPKVGRTAVDRVTFVSRCAAGACTLEMWGPTGPDPSKQGYYSFYSSSSGLMGPPVSTPMTESGATYSGTIPIGGYGGFTCPPSKTVARPEQRLSLTVTDAIPTKSGWTATRMSGQETFLEGWGCGPSGFTGWIVGHLSISGSSR